MRFAYALHMRQQNLVPFPCLYIEFFELVIASSTTAPRLPATKLICSNVHSGAAALSASMMLLCCSLDSSSFTLRKSLYLSDDRLNPFCPLLAGWIRKLVPGRPWAHASLFPFRNDVIIYCCSYAVDGHVFLLSECPHHYWCEFCQSWVQQQRDPCWVHDPKRSWDIGISVGCPCHSVEFPQKHSAVDGTKCFAAD